MGLPKGKTNNPDGRPAGSKNKCTAELRSLITEFLNDNFEQVKQDFQDMQPKDRLHFYTKLLQFALPRPIESKIDFKDVNKQHEPVKIIFSDIEAENLQGDE